MLEHLLHANLTLNGAEQAKETDDYFTWSDELLEQCIACLNGPGFVDQIPPDRQSLISVVFSSLTS